MSETIFTYIISALPMVFVWLCSSVLIFESISYTEESRFKRYLRDNVHIITIRPLAIIWATGVVINEILQNLNL